MIRNQQIVSMSDEETVYSQKTARSMAYSSVNGFREAVPQRISQQ